MQFLFFILFPCISKVLFAQILRSIQTLLAVLPQIIQHIKRKEKDSTIVFTPFALPLFSFSTVTTPLIQISFSPQPSAAIKIKVGGHDFR